MTSHPLIGKSKAMEQLRQSISETAPDITVLIQGETGTGKELVARAIHDGSPRSRFPFVAVNCAGIPASLVESELFGHEKGAFTGALAARKGRFEQADTGSLFLDEIGELELPVQAKLLRVLQEHEVDRLGGLKPVPVNFRLIAATNKNLEALSAAGAFRADLYYRLNIDLIEMPPLRERLEDIEELAHHFIQRYGSPRGRTISGVSEEVLELFQNHSWPGNVRELENVMQRALSKCKGRMITRKDLPDGTFRKADLVRVQPRDYKKVVNEASLQICTWAIEAASGNWRKAARLLGLNRTTFYRIAKRHGLEDLLEG